MENIYNQYGSSDRKRSRNRNRNRNRNRGGNQSENQGSQSQPRSPSRKRSRNRSRDKDRNSPNKVVKLTFLQKIMKFFGFKSGEPGLPRPTKNSSSTGSPAPVTRESSRTEPSAGKIREVTTSRLYVGNLDFSAAESDLEELFRGVGKVVSAEVVINPRTHQSKGFAFVEMASIAEARRAVEVLHNQDFMGRSITVSAARSEGPRSAAEDAEE